jgi:hypothetical protein
MPLNLPTYDENQFSFGPGVVYFGATGTTPSTEVGAITEDGVSIDITSEKKVITAGNPKLPIYAFSQAQGCSIKFSGIEWDFNDMAKALGAGLTTSSGGVDSFSFGGDPIVTQVAIKMTHAMAVTGQTMNAYVWKAYAEAGMPIAFGADEHKFAHSYMGLRSATDWSGATLTYKQQLFRLARQTS